MPPTSKLRNAAVPERIRAFGFHGIDLTVDSAGRQANADCPFCGADGKFTVAVDTGLWRCWVCGVAGNPLGFIRTLHECGMRAALAAHTAATAAFAKPHRLRRSVPPIKPTVNGTANPNGVSNPFLSHEALAHNRRLVSPATLLAWGVCQSPIGGGWLVPGYGPDGKLDQLYRWVKTVKGMRLLPTPGLWPEGRGHALHLPHDDYNSKRASVVVCEGPWDGMALWEVQRAAWGDANIIAVPGATVWQDSWTELCQGKAVTLLYDSDHPRTTGGHTARAGYDGMVRVAKRLSGVATEVRWVVWGPNGYDPARPSGWDVRDLISGSPGASSVMLNRQKALVELMSKIENVPTNVTNAVAAPSGGRSKGIEPIACQCWDVCIAAWEEAMRWRKSMSDVMAVLLAVCASTKQAGNQLFVQVIGNAGSGKTTMCEGLLTSNHCHHLEHLTGFHSGWKGETDKDGKHVDCSLIARINGKTLVTPEADIMMSSPRFTEIMSQQRRIFDGTSGASYKNSKEDTLHTGLRTPWIMAGTPALMDTDQSRLGDRFLRVCIDEPSENEKDAILRSAFNSEMTALLNTSNGTASSIIDAKTRKAQALTGGYVNWLRANIEEQLASIIVPEEVGDQCRWLAELSADLRARPNEDKNKKETHNAKELPTRLTKQNARLAIHLAVVLNRPSIDPYVMQIVRKVALDTASGHSLEIVKWMMAPKPGTGMTYHQSGGIPTRVLELWLNMPHERALNYLQFLKAIHVVEFRESRVNTGTWVLTPRVVNLYNQVRSIGE